MSERESEISAEEVERIAAKLAQQRQFQLIGLSIVIAVALVALISRLSAGVVFGLSFSFWGPFAVVLLLAKLAFFMATWRCPRCRTSLGSTYWPRYCSGCGIKLGRDGE